MQDILWRIEYGLVRCVFFLVRLFPLGFWCFPARMLGCFGFFVLAKRRRDALANLRLISGNDADEHALNRIACRSCQHLVYAYLEFIHCTRSREKVKTYGAFTAAEQKTLDGYYGRRKGLMYLTAHIGNWEFLSLIAGVSGFPLTSIGRAVKNPYLTQYVNRLRSITGSAIIDKKDAVRGTLDVLRKKECLGTLVDQRGGDSGIVIQFMGQPASATPFPALMKLRFDCALVPIFCIRERVGKFSFVIGDEIVVPPGVTDKDEIIRSVTQAYTDEIEKVVRRYPEQWLWFHRRWRL